jgi:hypothetical protein
MQSIYIKSTQTIISIVEEEPNDQILIHLAYEHDPRYTDEKTFNHAAAIAKDGSPRNTHCPGATLQQHSSDSPDRLDKFVKK